MGKITSKADMISYATRKLGSPVIMINLDNTQMEDAVDDAVQMFCEFHRDGSQLHHYDHVITAEDVTNGYITIPEDKLIEDVEEF